jgi:hypothetical protein
MRVFFCLFLLLPACASHAVRCDGRLQRVNLPIAGVAGVASRPPAAVASGVPAGASAGVQTGVAPGVPAGVRPGVQTGVAPGITSPRRTP